MPIFTLDKQKGFPWLKGNHQAEFGAPFLRYNRNIVGSPVIETIRGNELVESIHCKQGGTAMRRPCLAMGLGFFLLA